MQTGRSRIRWVLAALAAVLAVAVVAEVSRHAVGPIQAPGAAAKIGGTDLSGKKWSLAELKGRPVLVNFFSTT